MEARQMATPLGLWCDGDRSASSAAASTSAVCRAERNAQREQGVGQQRVVRRHCSLTLPQHTETVFPSVDSCREYTAAPSLLPRPTRTVFPERRNAEFPLG